MTGRCRFFIIRFITINHCEFFIAAIFDLRRAESFGQCVVSICVDSLRDHFNRDLSHLVRQRLVNVPLNLSQHLTFDKSNLRNGIDHNKHINRNV